MNYFGHAALAWDHRPEPGFVLGAMLPDLAGMLRTACPTAPEGALRAGLGFHVATDAVFHQCASFLRLNYLAVVELRGIGVGRGPARAIAHLGTEMLLDSVLTETPRYAAGYLEALLRAEDLATTLEWQRPEDGSTFARLTAHLFARGVHAHDAAPEQMVQRLSRALEGHARLTPSQVELASVAGWLPGHTRRVRRAAGELLQELREGLTLSPGAELG